MEKQTILSIYNSERGVSAILVAIMIFMFMAFVALAVDLNHLFVAHNELKNAADAGALAGARFLYNDDGEEVNTGANQIGHDAAVANQSERVPVEVNWDGDNMTADVRRGHWSFGLGDLDKGFYPSNNTEHTILWGRSTVDLDEDTTFINAVEVTTHREGTPIASFFAQLIGYENFQRHVTSVAYIGFAGDVDLEDLEVPIAICRESITLEDGIFDCHTGRMIDSSGGTSTNSAAWTNMEQSEDSCEESEDPPPTASTPTVRPLVCGGNTFNLLSGDGLGTTGGMVNTVYDQFRDCWINHGGDTPDLGQNDDPITGRKYPTKPWIMTLPVIECPGSNPGPCSDFLTIVGLEVLWVKKSSADPHWEDIPVQMEYTEYNDADPPEPEIKTWQCQAWLDFGSPTDINALPEGDRQACWQEFATKFDLTTADGTPVGNLTPSVLQKTIFFKPSCDVQDPQGSTSDINTGILAERPVLVQ